MEKGQSLGFLFSEDRILLPQREISFQKELARLHEKLDKKSKNFWNYGGKHQEWQIFWSDFPLLERQASPESMCLLTLREAASLYHHDIFALISKITHIRHWQKRTRFCGVCGTPAISLEEEEHFRRCPQCNSVFYPKISPAVIVRIEKENAILLARNAHFPTAMYSLIAGFVEPGEALEDAVRREIAEEVGISVKEIKYYGSQPWPFPDSLMIGFTAQWGGGKIQVDNKEILEAHWFSFGNIPSLPKGGSIAYKMIIDWILSQEKI